jgi:hypothetical protein
VDSRDTLIETSGHMYFIDLLIICGYGINNVVVVRSVSYQPAFVITWNLIIFSSLDPTSQMSYRISSLSHSWSSLILAILFRLFGFIVPKDFKIIWCSKVIPEMCTKFDIYVFIVPTNKLFHQQN